MRQKNLDLLLVLVIVALNVLSVLIPWLPSFIKITLALPLIFVIPGYVLSDFIFQRRTLERYHQLTFSLALSLVVVILSGFLLNCLPGGLQTATWTVFFAAFATTFSLYALFLRRKAQKNTQPSTRFRLAPQDALCLLFALIASIGSLVYSTNSVSQQPHRTYTQLWMVPTQKNTHQWLVNIGIQNEEDAALQYQLVLSINGKETKTWSPIPLASQQTWKQEVPLVQGTAEGDTSVELRLYRSGQTSNVYREVHITLKSTGNIIKSN
jgi:uncharacterized membrane protein